MLYIYTALPMEVTVGEWSDAKRGLNSIFPTSAHPAAQGLRGVLSNVDLNRRGGGLLSFWEKANAELVQVPWQYVTSRFDAFHSNIVLTERQRTDGLIKFAGLTSRLNTAFRGHNSPSENAFMIGSWGKDTCIRPPRDVDMYYMLPIEVYYRFEAYAAGVNKQSALLQEVKRKLLDSYPRSVIKGDGPVVLADFHGWTVEIAPAFILDSSAGSFYVCDTKNGGRYMTTKPLHEVEALNAADRIANGNARPLIRMLKCWQSYCAVPIKSFYLELVAAEFITRWYHRAEGVFYYDWMCRDFFQWMITRADQGLFAPGTNDIVWLGSAWKSRAESAYARAVKACELERENQMLLAGDEWQKIFGTDIPRIV